MVIETLVSLLLDLLVVGMLVTTVVFCARLNRRILVLQDSKGDMAQLIRQFDEATQKASNAVGELQDASAKLQDDMNTKIQKANFIADDLAFMIEKGNKVAEKMLSSAVQQTGASSPAPRASAPQQAAPSAAAQQAAANLAGARGPRLNVNPAASAEAAPANVGAGKAALSSVMERLGNKQGGPAAPAAPAPRTATVRSRSKSEQELLDALKNDV
jgi:hypothetical protein